MEKEEMTKEEQENFAKWLLFSDPDDIRKEMAAVEREIFRESIEEGGKRHGSKR